MPYYLLLAKDWPDGLDRRRAARSAHLELGDRLVAEGKLVYGGALLDENREMAGSMLVCHFDDRAELDAWLEIEPYVVQRVWRDLEVTEFVVGPSFDSPGAPGGKNP